MTFHMRLTAILPVVAASLWLVATSIAFTQDVMELDLAFKNGLLSGHAAEVRQETSAPQGRRHDAGNAKERIEEKKRHIGRRRGQGR